MGGQRGCKALTGSQRANMVQLKLRHRVELKKRQTTWGKKKTGQGRAAHTPDGGRGLACSGPHLRPLSDTGLAEKAVAEGDGLDFAERAGHIEDLGAGLEKLGRRTTRHIRLARRGVRASLCKTRQRTCR